MKFLDALDSIFTSIGNTVAIGLLLIAVVMPALQPIMMVLLPIVFLLGTLSYGRQQRWWLTGLYGVIAVAVIIFDFVEFFA
ncbi:hypothetical protein [Lacticaseibacillus nasuensis]|uniref:Uncharacterized protein n=1 Tax=Lacticaseibacillus nasuensis JCM 17158 TaxID=1291734 RepID=A0A0R1JTB2_9LACO|nr:hypothetical protein [Lacticaseibacillus nasuensis]KRK74312.1 hypothetical protein FD02_GL000913 [Lacticaseibacillus nasuensis JCM 17158]